MPKTKYARDRWEYPRVPVVPRRIRRRRFALTLALTAIFFAGAALAAGADNQPAQSTDGSTVTVATDATSTDTTPDAATTTVDTTTDVTTTTDSATTTTDEEPTTDAAPATTTDAVTETTPAPTPDDATTTDAAPVTTTDDASLAATPASADAASTTPAPNSTEATTAPTTSVVAAPRRASTPRMSVRTTAVHRAQKLTRTTAPKKKPTPVRTLDQPLAIPYHAIVFDPQQWLNDNPGTSTGQAAVSIAMNYLGVPYRWGGAVPETGFDCSGLVRFVYAQLGIGLVHYAAAQFAAFPKLSPAQLQPGDLVFFEPKLDGPGHVGLYIGNDEMIEAPHTGAVVRIASVSGAAAQLGFMGAVRPYGDQLLGGLSLMSAVESRPASLLSKIPY